MDIIKEDINELNAVIKVKLGPEDYQSKVDNALREYQKKANMPGFRPGKVPSGMIKKMYGKSILVDEINKLLSESLHKYISESKLEVLGNPLPKMGAHQIIDWNNQRDFEFFYDLGLAPSFNVVLSENDKFSYTTINIDDALLNKTINDIAKRYGTMTNPEISEGEDVLFGDFVEMDQDSTIIPGGIFKSSSLTIERIKNEKLKNNFIGVQKGDKIIIGASAIAENPSDLSALLGIDKETAENNKSNFQFTVSNINRMEAAELTQEFIDKVYGSGNVNGEEEFKNKIKEELAGMFINDSDRLFYNEVVEALLTKTSMALPDEFLKRWLISANEKPVTMEQVNAEYDSYVKGLKWQLIENKIIKDNSISISKEEIVDHAKVLIQHQYVKYNGVEMNEEDLSKTMSKVFANQDEMKKLHEKLYNLKMLDLFKKTFSIENKEISYDEFYKIKN